MATHIRLEHGQRIDKIDFFREYTRKIIRGDHTDNSIHHLRDYGAALIMNRAVADEIVDEEIATWT